MGFEDLDITSPSNEDIFSYSGLTPPNITLSGTHPGESTYTGLEYKWFSTNPRIKTASTGEHTKFTDAHLNYGAGSSDTDDVTFSVASSFTWDSARVGSQYISFNFDNPSDGAIVGADDVETELQTVTRNGIDGTDQTVAEQDINPMKIHVVGAFGMVAGANEEFKITDLDSVVVSTTAYDVGCMVPMNSNLSDGNSVEYNTNSDTAFDEVEYKLEDVTGTPTTLFDTSSDTTDTVTYRSIDDFAGDTGFTMTGIAYSETKSDGAVTDYTLTVSKGATSISIDFTVTITL